MICFCKTVMEQLNINKYKLYRCPKCGYLKKDIVISDIDAKARYDKHICDESYKKYMVGIYNTIKESLNDGISLDYGCGQIHELSNIMNLNNQKCYYYDLYYFNEFKDIKYDNIILIEVFEHIDDIYNLLLNLKNNLNKNGRIIIMTERIPDDINNWWYLRDLTHVSFVSNKTMEMLKDLLNFKLIIKEKYYVLEKI